MTTITYTIPATPQAPKTSPALDKACHGALNTAEMNKTAQKCTTVGVPKARTSSMLAAASASAISAITTNSQAGQRSGRGADDHIETFPGRQRLCHEHSILIGDDCSVFQL